MLIYAIKHLISGIFATDSREERSDVRQKASRISQFCGPVLQHETSGHSSGHIPPGLFYSVSNWQIDCLWNHFMQERCVKKISASF